MKDNLITKPMLAGTVTDFSKIKFPVLVTPKIDGIRCLRINGRSVSRSFKEIPNRYIQEKMKDLPDGLDGELVIKGGFQKTTSGVMSRDGEPDFEYYIFDWVPMDFRCDWIEYAYWVRMNKLNQLELPSWCIKLIPEQIPNIGNLELFESEMFALGYEGIMIRQPDSPYKCGRSTEKEGYLLKIKRFEDAEAAIIGFEEQMENCNELGKDELGHAKRSTSKDGKFGKNTLGSLIVVGKPPFCNQRFKIGTGVGLTQELRQDIWNHPIKYIGRMITYKYQKTGTLNLPRLPIFKGFRGEE